MNAAREPHGDPLLDQVRAAFAHLPGNSAQARCQRRFAGLTPQRLHDRERARALRRATGVAAAVLVALASLAFLHERPRGVSSRPVVLPIAEYVESEWGPAAEPEVLSDLFFGDLVE